MKTKYKFIHIDTYPDEYRIINNRSSSVLGHIEWAKNWKQWVVAFYDNTIWSAGCLVDVLEFMGQLKDKP